MIAQEASDGAVAARERWFGTLQAHSRDLIAALDDRARVFYVTPAADRMLGFVPDEHLVRNMFEMIHPMILTRSRRCLSRELAAPGPPRLSSSGFRR